MKPVAITDGVYNVGVTDWNIRDFHGYSTDRGTTYNAFLILDENITLIDTVKAPFADQLLQNIRQIVDPKKIDLVISNHTEMDHSGGLPRVMHAIGEDKPLYCSKMGHKNLQRHFPRLWDYRPVADGETLSLGKRTLTFLETRMIHWPDSMFTFLNEDGILFSSDGFGQHYAGSERFDDEVSDLIMPHAKKYFANILLLYAPRIQKLLEKVVGLGLDIRMICPDHGIVWRSDPGRIIDAYMRWCRQEPKPKAVILYDTMWQSTEKMAQAVADGIMDRGVPARLMHIRSNHRSDIMTAVMDSGLVVVGSPTLNNGLFPTVADVLTYVRGLKPVNKIGAAFGSYGWSGEAPKQISALLEAMDFRLPLDPLRVQYVPEESALQQCEAFGSELADELGP
jgi:flavorubredoxin